MKRANRLLRMLIVDDEPFMREGLKVYLDWAEYGIGECRSAGDGQSALQIAKEMKPDIVITDIRMPEMDGLEMLEKMKRLLPDCVCIIISGYNDFTYAQKSIALGAFYYIVKPIELDELKSVIQNAVETVRNKEQERKLLSMVQASDSQAKKLMTDVFFTKLIRQDSPIAVEEVQRKMAELSLAFPFPCYVACVTRVSGAAGKKQGQANEIFALAERKIRAAFFKEEAETGQSARMAHCFSYQDSLVTLVGFADPKRMEQELFAVFHELSDLISACFQLSQVTAVGGCVSNLQDLSLSYHEAEKRCAYHAFFGKSGVFCPHSNAESSGEDPYPMFLISASEKAHFLSAVESNDLAEIKEMLSHWSMPRPEGACQDKEILFSILLELMISAARLMDSKRMELEQFVNVELFTYEFLETFDYVGQLFEWLNCFFVTLSNHYAHKENTAVESRLTEQIKAYTAEHLGGDLNLAIIADYFHYNSNYIGRLFKKGEGVKYSDYLNRMRVEEACRLLSTTELSVEAIACQVGYNDCQYFIKVFKGYLSITPRKYRTSNSALGQDKRVVPV